MKTKTTERKLSGPIEIKDDGRVTAVFATLNVADSDGDVTLPGAFTEGQEVFLSEWNHSSVAGTELPVGRGKIRVSGTKIFVDAEYFVNTKRGREAFETIKAMGPLAQWSYGYIVRDYEPGDRAGVNRYLTEIEVYEASPVYRGAGVGTGTVSVSADEEAARQLVRWVRLQHEARMRDEYRKKFKNDY
jgi:hypothetical protein